MAEEQKNKVCACVTEQEYSNEQTGLRALPANIVLVHRPGLKTIFFLEREPDHFQMCWEVGRVAHRMEEHVCKKPTNR